MAKLKPYQRSIKAHIRLRNIALSNDDNVKVCYHNSVILEQHRTRSKMTKYEKRKLFDSCKKRKF